MSQHSQATVKPTSPLHQFREFVAQRLQKVPFGWPGAAGYELTERHADLVQRKWAAGITVDETAHAVHRAQMERPQTVKPITRATLVAAGCVFNKYFNADERDQSERQGDRIDMFRREI